MVVVLAVFASAILVLLWIARVSRAPDPIALRSPIRTLERVGPPWAYPDPVRTPGARNPSIDDGNIGETICNPEWTTRSVRPRTSYTNRLKKSQMRELGLPGGSADYEEDHLISLELGGSPGDPRNLWPEPYDPRPGAREKDAVERYLHKEVCDGAMTLREAQSAIATDWYKVYSRIRE